MVVLAATTWLILTSLVPELSQYGVLTPARGVHVVLPALLACAERVYCSPKTRRDGCTYTGHDQKRLEFITQRM